MEFVNIEENEQVREILKSNDNNLNKLINLRNLIFSNFNLFVKYQCKLNKINDLRDEIKTSYEDIKNLKKIPYSFNSDGFEKVFNLQKIIKHFHNYENYSKGNDVKIYKDEIPPLDIKTFENIQRQISERDNKIDEIYRKINIDKNILKCKEYNFIIFLDEKLDDYINKIKKLNDGIIPRFIEKDTELDKIIDDLNYMAFVYKSNNV